MAAKKSKVLSALLWKAFRTRLRNPVSWLFDIISPALLCCLFFLMAFAMNPIKNPNCNLKAKALPSASGMLFLQTLLCAASNTCEDEEKASSSSFNSSLLSNVGEDLKKAFNIKAKRSDPKLNLTKWSKDFDILDSLIEAIDNENKKWQLLYSTLLRSNIYSTTSESENSHIKKLLRIKRNIQTAGVLDSLIFVLTDEDEGFWPSIANFLNLFLCGPDMQKIEIQLIQVANNIAAQETKEDDDMNDYCNNMIKKFEKTQFKLILQFFKPLLFGKVIYTPDAPVINRIMNRLGDSFTKIKNLLDLMKVANRAWTELRAWKLHEVINKYIKEENFLKEAVKTKTGRAIMEHYEVETNDDPEGKTAKRKIDIYKKLLNKTEEKFNTYLRKTDAKTDVSNLLSILECIDFDKVIGVGSEGDALGKALKFLEKNRLWGYIIFTNVPAGAEKLPPSITYKMRIASDRSPNTQYKKKVINKTGVLTDPINGIKEIQGGTVYLQNMIESELIREYTGRKDVPGIYLNQLPYPCFRQDGFYCGIVKRLVIEKEILFKEILRIFGVSNAYYWTAVFIEAFVTGFLAVLLLSMILKILLGHFTVIFLFQLACMTSVIALAFLVSTFFLRSSYCTILAACIYLFLYLFNSLTLETSSTTGQIFLCFISVSATLFGATWVENMELSNVPVSVALLNYSPDSESSLTMLLIICMLLIDSVIYILLATYFENVISTKTVRKPWNYCFKASYWKNCFKMEPEVETSEPETTPSRKKRDSKNFEAEPEGKIGIEVINVSKEFGRSKNKIRVVNNLSINFYENQITSFLGHNGAGKSTTVMMLTGVLSPTKGTIRIYGVDLRKNPEQALNNVGICLQENVILGELTVRDHLILIGKLKGLNKNELNRNLNELLEDFELTSRAGQPVKQLSGGWKRKVCIAMAFMGGSRTIFLDEPTAGIDPFARRSLWDVLVKLKKGRTIVLITHHLDEADILGDRIAIIASGELKCCGSSSFLKSNLDKGYILTVDTTVRPDNTSSKKNTKTKKRLSPQAQELLSLVKSSIHGSEIEEERGCEYVFSLPPKQSSVDLNRLFEALDRNKKKMNINSYGVSAVSLEEVFMKVLMTVEAEENNGKDAGGSANQKSSSKNNDGNKSARESKGELSIGSVSSKKASDTKRNSNAVSEEIDMEKLGDRRKSNDSRKISSASWQQAPNSDEKKMASLREKEKFMARTKFWNHFLALWIKRIQHYRRNYIFLLLQILLPLIFALLGLIAISLAVPKLPSVTVDVSAYDSSIIFYTNNIPANSHISSYEDAFLGPYGLGTKCVLSPEKCSLKSIPKGSMVAEINETIASNKCTCKDFELKCEGNATAEPPEAKMTTGHRLFNMTGLDLNNWLIATEFKYSIKRIGGITFGYVSSLTGVSVADFLSLFSEKNLLNILEKYTSGDRGKIDPKEFTSEIMSGVNKTFGGELFKEKDSVDNIIVWFNSVDKIASMALINGVSNIVLRASLPAGTDPSIYSIRLIVHPFPSTGYADTAESRTQLLNGLVITLLHSLAFLFALLIVHLVDERSCGMKHLALISGVNPLIYWCSYFVWDMVIFSIYFVLLLLLLVIFDITAFCGSHTLPVFAAVLYSYAVTTFIFICIISHIFSVPGSAIIFLIVWMIIIGGLGFIFCDVLISLNVLKVVVKIFLLIPECCLGVCLMNLARYRSRNVASSAEFNYFQWDISTQYIIRILINGGVYLIILMLIEFRNVQPFGIFTKCCSSLKLLCVQASSGQEDDEDVAAERERIRSNKAKEEGDMLIIKNLTKIYCGQVNPAANHVYVGVKQGECLGLLGMNGAGKTTIFKMISGTSTPTSGDATIRGFSITYSPIKSRILMGYCPQMNALDPYLTPVEHLTFFCRIRGYNKKRRNKETDALIELLNLSKHKKKISKTLSGGNKRKLNAAIALLSEPELILLDEPTAGMDVLARRFLWSRLLEVLQDGRCLVLTTHSMEECQALATQVCIMYKGQFVCFGTSQHLKNKFNDGYSVSLRLTHTDNYKDVMNYLNENLPGFTVLSTHILHVKIKLHPDANIGKAVSILGEIKKKQWIEDYSVNQTTLESVFLKLIGEVNRDTFKKPCCSC